MFLVFWGFLEAFVKVEESYLRAYSAYLVVQSGAADRESAAVTDTKRTLEEARKLTSSREILLWMTPSEAPKALQASECSELLDPMRASCWISAQH